jgi:hypothetical protein
MADLRRDARLLTLTVARLVLGICGLSFEI